MLKVNFKVPRNIEKTRMSLVNRDVHRDVHNTLNKIVIGTRYRRMCLHRSSSI